MDERGGPDLRIDQDGAEPPYQQLRTQLIDQIMGRLLPAGTKLPAVRTLAATLGLANNTVAKAYRELEAEGYVCSVAGRGSYVCAQIPEDPARQVALLQQFDAAVQELLYLGMRSEELRRRIPEGGTNHD